MTFEPGDEVTLGKFVRIHVVDHVSYMPEVVRTKCGKLGFAYEVPPWFNQHCRECQKP